MKESPHNTNMTTAEMIEALEKEIEEKKKELVELRKSVPATTVQDYSLVTPEGTTVLLSELFGEFDEMLLIHNMGTGCAYCTLWADGFNDFYPYFRTKCAFVLASPDPVHRMAQFAASREWQYPVVSIHDTSLTKDFNFTMGEEATWPGVTALKKQPDGTMTRHAQAFFGPGDDYCSIWGLMALLPSGVGDWEPNYNK